MIVYLSLSHTVQNSSLLCLKIPYPSSAHKFLSLFFSQMVKSNLEELLLTYYWLGNITILISDLRAVKACLLFCSYTYWFNTSPIHLVPLTAAIWSSKQSSHHLPMSAKSIWVPHNEKWKKSLRVFLTSLENVKLLLRFSDNNHYFLLIEVGNIHIISHSCSEVSPFHQRANVLEHCGWISILFIWFDLFVRCTEKDCDNLIECIGETALSCGQRKEEQSLTPDAWGLKT